MFYSALNDTGRAGFVMANSASDARASELEIRKQLLEAHAVDVVIAIGPNMFYTVTLPCTLWFLDKGKRDTDRADKVLFIDARNIYRQIDRAHRDFRPTRSNSSPTSSASTAAKLSKPIRGVPTCSEIFPLMANTTTSKVSAASSPWAKLKPKDGR